MEQATSRSAERGESFGGKSIDVIGARTHNLKNVTVSFPVDECTVIVGPSGSGKSSLAFGTVHAAAHAAYLEGMSSYSRFTEVRLAAPDVDEIRGLRPTLALAQGYGSRSSRSTVGTVTDTLSLLRLLFSRLGHPTRSAGQLSFLSAEAVCLRCGGVGTERTPVVERLLDPTRTLEGGALLHRAWKVGGRYWNILQATGQVPMDVKVRRFTPAQLEFLLNAPPQEVTNRTPGFVQRFTYEGIISRVEKRIGDGRELSSRTYDLSFFDERPCSDCGGTRLRASARDVRIGDTTFASVLTMELVEILQFVANLRQPAAHSIRRRLKAVVGRMVEMGLGHLTLHRATSTLSGGELRRVRIAHQLVSPLEGLMYVVDEPSAGLHFEEGLAVYESLRHLRDSGNTVLLVDHSDLAFTVADHVIHMGPGGGGQGGHLVWAGPKAEYAGPYGRMPSLRRPRREVTDQAPRFTVHARSHNLRGQRVAIPKQRFVVLVGPSGSGKTSLALDAAAQWPASVLLSQRDLAGSVRSVIATYLGIFDPIRNEFARVTGRSASDFTFNGAGACSACGGWGYIRMDMQFLEDVTGVCEECGGRRYRPELLELRVRGLSIADVLDLTISEARDVYRDRPTIARILDIASAVGIGHLVIGQSTDTLSGGEAQRIRIAAEVSAPQRSVLLLDEPTRGLGYDEIPQFIDLVDQLLDQGKSVIAIEHNLSVIAAADWLIELGPGSGQQGGLVVAEGTQDDILAAGTMTARALVLRGLATRRSDS